MDDHRGHILIVDDNRVNRMVLERAVSVQGHRATTAEDGRQALALLQSEEAGPFDVVLLDVLMPELDGYQSLEAIKQDPDLHHIPVIMISALDELDSVIRCIEMGATDYLTKPIKPALLRARLNASLAEKRLRDLELEYLEQVGRVMGAAEAVEQARFDPGSLDQVAAREDALGQLARVFQRMAREVHLREQRLKNQLDRLRLDIDEMKKAQAEPLSVYLPMDRRHTLVQEKSLPDRAHGAALFADISGFTALTAALAKELGLQEGAEELTRHLNRVFGSLIAEVHRFGGSAISFGGDAITCWLDGDNGLRALACALAMQRSLADFSSIETVTGSSFSLSIKVAVVTGPVRRLLVGDPQVQVVEVLAGNTFERLAAAEQNARSGEVVVPAELVDLAPGKIVVSDWRTDGQSGERFAVVSDLQELVPSAPWPDLPLDALTEEQCRPWLLPPVYERVRSGAKQFLSELRPLAALFLNFSGIDYDGDEEAGIKLDAYIRWVQSVLQLYEGFLIQLIFGDKGSYLYAAFGAPVAHNDDAVRAVYAALALRSPPPELGYVEEVQIGLSQGQMWAGAYGSTTRRTYGAIGDRMNLAARLMQAAGRDILCDEAIFQAAQSRLVFEQLPAIQVKGKAEPITVYRPTGEKKRFARQRPALVGRSAERVRLREALQTVLKGTTQAVILEGEAGIGKSRLLEEVRQQAEEMGVLTCQVTGNANQKAIPFFAWREPFQSLYGSEGLADPDRWLRRLEKLLTYDLDDRAHVRQAEGDQKSEGLLALLKEATGAASVVICVENGQELDPDSWALAAAAAQHVRPLLLAVSTRPLPEPLPAGYTQLQRLPDLQTLALRALSADEAYLLACEHLGVVSLPEQLVMVIREAAGNPFVIEELIYLLRDDGYITIADGRCQLAPNVDLGKIVLPTTARGVIISRIDQLSPSEQLVLKVASVIGTLFPRQILYDIYPVDSDKAYLGSHLQTLEQLDLISRVDASESFTFRNTLIQETAYSALLFAQRRHLHRQVAEWIEAAYPSDLSPHYVTLARHWRLADEPTKAIDYLEKAGQQAKDHGAYNEAESFLRQSLELNARSAVLSRDFFADPE